MVKELTAEQVRLQCTPTVFKCDSTEELRPKDGIIGQDRALSALKFGLNIAKPGFNVYVSGLAGTGRTTAIKSFMEALAARKETPSDWCYVHNFRDSYCPHALMVPAGMGEALRRDMEVAIDNARRSLVQTFTSKEYAQRREEITEDFNKKRATVFKILDKKAREKGFILQATPVGVVFVPAADGEPMSEEAYNSLDTKEKEALKKKQDELTGELKEQIARLTTEQSAIDKQLEDTDREVAGYSIRQLFEKLREKYGQLPQVVAYLKEVEQDIVANFEQFRAEPKAQDGDPLASMREVAQKQALRKYEVNLLVDNSEVKGAPVILELNPTFSNLLGRIEKEAQFGALSTDFTMIKGGSLHHANGGYLVVRIEDILTNFQSWEGLKRTLRDGKLAIEELGERLGYVVSKSLRPEPIPLEVKVVLIGEPMFYYMLLRLDLDFKELFKVKADFDSRMDRTAANLKDYAAVICRICHSEGLKHLSSGALAQIIEHSSRLAGDQKKLSALFADIADILREASFWAEEDKAKHIEGRHVDKAIEEKVYRSNLIQQRINEMIDDGVIMIDAQGEKVGQVNGLAVIDLGDFAFGRPSRITASVGVGRGGLIDIEREAKLGGRLHTKGVMILNGYITDRYVGDIPLSLSARLVFEQSYDEVDGDSASSTELYAILSRLADVPIKQGIAVTGSVNQKGEVQAIGGINEKIEGFFEVCRAKGLNGEQGVLIPASNVRNLMLKEEVAAAVKEGKFHVYPVSTIDQGIEVLTGVKAGKRLKGGSFEAGSINDLVQKRLASLAEKLRDFTRGEEKEGKAKAKGGGNSKE
ncbi:MAG: AAA family ATPase [Deltaproteobacteria bacterium]|nr:AAA family ATPase [Deltaproteobacteria bacterium]